MVIRPSSAQGEMAGAVRRCGAGDREATGWGRKNQQGPPPNATDSTEGRGECLEPGSHHVRYITILTASMTFCGVGNTSFSRLSA
jgi:hypothetical protein